jgi:hypothetical protein
MTVLRAAILEKLNANAPIEPGPLTVTIRRQESRTFSYDKLVNLVGEEYANALRERIEPTVSTHVIVRASSGIRATRR